MISQWTHLRDLRRDAEGIAQRALAEASSALARAQEEQARLVRAWERARALLDAETRRLASPPAPASAAQGSARERYLGRLQDEAHRLKSAADEHRGGALAAAHASNDNAAGRQENRRVEMVVSGDAIGSPANATIGSLR